MNTERLAIKRESESFCESFIRLNERFVSRRLSSTAQKSPRFGVNISCKTAMRPRKLPSFPSAVNTPHTLFLLPRQLYLQSAAGKRREEKQSENVMDCRARMNSHFVITRQGAIKFWLFFFFLSFPQRFEPLTECE